MIQFLIDRFARTRAGRLIFVSVNAAMAIAFCMQLFDPVEARLDAAKRQVSAVDEERQFEIRSMKDAPDAKAKWLTADISRLNRQHEAARTKKVMWQLAESGIAVIVVAAILLSPFVALSMNDQMKRKSASTPRLLAAGDL